MYFSTIRSTEEWERFSETRFVQKTQIHLGGGSLTIAIFSIFIAAVALLTLSILNQALLDLSSTAFNDALITLGSLGAGTAVVSLVMGIALSRFGQKYFKLLDLEKVITPEEVNSQIMQLRSLDYFKTKGVNFEQLVEDGYITYEIVNEYRSLQEKLDQINIKQVEADEIEKDLKQKRSNCLSSGFVIINLDEKVSSVPLRLIEEKITKLEEQVKKDWIQIQKMFDEGHLAVEWRKEHDLA